MGIIGAGKILVLNYYKASAIAKAFFIDYYNFAIYYKKTLLVIKSI